jgi:hypothetical protein
LKLEHENQHKNRLERKIARATLKNSQLAFFIAFQVRVEDFSLSQLSRVISDMKKSEKVGECGRQCEEGGHID